MSEMWELAFYRMCETSMAEIGSCGRLKQEPMKLNGTTALSYLSQIILNADVAMLPIIPPSDIHWPLADIRVTSIVSKIKT
jgi:hypothetical protein